jgi:predicted nucleic acid-binding protein
VTNNLEGVLTRSGDALTCTHDLIIAAHALQSGRVVLSSDANARFGDLPGVSATAI